MKTVKNQGSYHAVFLRLAEAIRRISLVFFFIFLFPIEARVSAQCPLRVDFAKESLPYEVVYNWGIIWKRAALATLSLDTGKWQGKSVYRARLTARTLSFADPIFRVRDTLLSVMSKNELIPYYFAKIADEDNTYRKDEVFYHYKNGVCVGRTRLYRPKRNAIDTTTLSTSPCAYDMLSVFYYLRSVDFLHAKINQQFQTRIFSGLHVEYLTIEYLGKTVLKIDKREFPAFKVRLYFFNDKGKKVSDNITAWISNDARRIPLQIEGKLKIGSLKAIYLGK